VRLEEFKTKVFNHFGNDLEHATPANVRAFLDEVQQSLSSRPGPGRPWVIDETAGSYEEVLRQFFARVLEFPPEEAVMALWLVAFEACFAALMELESMRFERLFRVEDPDEDV